MQTESHVPLNRRFSPVPKSQEGAENDEILSSWGNIGSKTWDDLAHEFRCVILAEAGAGKTEELRHQALRLANQGKPSFFIRIEDIEIDFYEAFEIGEEAQFQTWLQSTGEAWFFLDSVDEARLDNPRTLGKALRRFARGIKKGAHRAHVYLSSRPYAWRPRDDRRLLDEILFIEAPQEHETEDGTGQQHGSQSALTIYTLRPLDEGRIRHFCADRQTKNVDRLLLEIERSDLWSLAERPFDLESILSKWTEDGALGGRLDLLSHNIDKRLRDDHCEDRAQRQPLNRECARDGARRLAAAVVLSGKAGLNVPDAPPVKPGIEAESVLSGWDPRNVRALLERGIFNDIIYGAVRFRHRDVRELLAAEWFDELLKAGNSRRSVEDLFFKEFYGEEIIVPRLRPVLPWLILFDEGFRRRALKVHPEIAVEGGDPSQLPLSERQRILTNIVRRIVSEEDDGSARDNNAIARIASPDLSADTLQLISDNKTNDDAIFFLGRLVWQGEMVGCVAPLIVIAVDNSRGIYARRASVRAIMTCGSIEQKQSLWQQLNEAGVQIARELLAEVVDEAEPDSHSVKNLVTSLEKLSPYERYKATGLGRSLHDFIDRLPVVGNNQAIAELIDGLHGYLDMPPHVERGECHVSEQYAWLLGSATHAAERLVEARSVLALGAKALAIMLMVPALRFWRGGDFGEHKDNLQALVPSWPEVNDALYWACIEQARISEVVKSGEPLTDDWPASWHGHFWQFDSASLPRLLHYMCSRTLQDDRLVALSTAFRVYVQADRPTHIRDSIKGAVIGDSLLESRLDALLNPPASEEARGYEEKRTKRKREKGEMDERKKQARDTWIEELQTNPDRVRSYPGLKTGKLDGDHHLLLHEIQGCGLKTSRTDGANWQALIPEFGDAVAQAYRDAAINYWRYYRPSLRSEGTKRDNSIPYSLIFALAGLEIEAGQRAGFPNYLNERQVRHALRYVTWELNGFPTWFERIYQSFPALVVEAVIKEVHWELENTDQDESMHYILHDVAYHAPWLHASIAALILERVEASLTLINAVRHPCLHIWVNGGINPSRLGALASRQIALTKEPNIIAWWCALRVDCDPLNGIPEVEKWLAGLENEVAKEAAQVFIVALMGGNHTRQSAPHFGLFRTAKYLKSLYILMHHHIRAKEDNERAGSGVYSPNVRDDAQSARNSLFNLLSEIPGKESYTVIKELIQEHPDPNYRPWMVKHAYKRAEVDGDLEPWTPEQVSAFSREQMMRPETHRQLFDLIVHRLLDLKNWLESGNDSAWRTWQRVAGESEMRNLIASWLRQQCREQYITAQEPELANSQRMDIWLHNTSVQSPVPIELKLLDKSWTGPELCERLRNQLVGDYLREDGAECGVMLLISQKINAGKQWVVGGQRVGRSELGIALKSYWQNIAGGYPGVKSVEVIVIDLTQREQVSDS